MGTPANNYLVGRGKVEYKKRQACVSMIAEKQYPYFDDDSPWDYQIKTHL